MKCPDCGKSMSSTKWENRTINGITYHCPSCKAKLHKEDLIL